MGGWIIEAASWCYNEFRACQLDEINVHSWSIWQCLTKKDKSVPFFLLIPVFDANGKLPAGILSSITDGCDLQKLTSDTMCGDQPYDFLKKLIKIPHGNTVSVGAVDECLRSTNDASGAPFKSRHVLLQLKPSDDLGRSLEFSFKGNKNLTRIPSVDGLANVLLGSLTVIFDGQYLNNHISALKMIGRQCFL